MTTDSILFMFFFHVLITKFYSWLIVFFFFKELSCLYCFVLIFLKNEQNKCLCIIIYNTMLHVYVSLYSMVFDLTTKLT